MRPYKANEQNKVFEPTHSIGLDILCDRKIKLAETERG